MREGGDIYAVAAREYQLAFMEVLERHGFIGSGHEWNGRG